jgi:predicted secreted hydrolase
MNPRRRQWLQAGAIAGWGGLSGVGRGADRTPSLQFPRDHGAHPDAQLEWWYATGWLVEQDGAEGGNLPTATGLDSAKLWGFQVTFFRVATGITSTGTSRFNPNQLLLAHAALTHVKDGRHVHAQRWARWDGQEDPARVARASVKDANLAMAGWRLQRTQPPTRQNPSGSHWWASVSADELAFDLRWQHAHGPWLQGDGGLSTKAPGHVSRYVSDTGGDCRGEIQMRSATPSAPPSRTPVHGRVWVDHEWSDAFLPALAVGWDWIGIHLDDGRSLMAFQLRAADGRTISAGGGLRGADGRVLRVYRSGDLRFEPLDNWLSPRTGARYPVRWRIHTPDGRWRIRALVNDQEMDSRASLGTVYWEGLSALTDDATDAPLGLGYLEMTGYAGRLRV